MQPPPPSEPIGRTLVFAGLGGVLLWLFARFAWPTIGPYLLEPCPIATPSGCTVALGVGMLWGAVTSFNLDAAERRRTRYLRGDP